MAMAILAFPLPSGEGRVCRQQKTAGTADYDNLMQENVVHIS